MSDHAIRVIRIGEILKHPNADKLEITMVGGFQVVVGKGNYKQGDLAVYVPPDSIMPEFPEYSFVWERDGGGSLRAFVIGEPVPEKYRRVTVRRLRKEFSEGLLLPTVAAYEDNVIDFYNFPTFAILRQGDKQIQVLEGLDVAEFLGITHYNPPDDEETVQTGPSVKQSKILPRSLKGWIYFLSYWLTLGLYNPWGNLGGLNEVAPNVTPPIYDVEAYKKHTSALELTEDEHLVITEKIHGSNARFVYQEAKWPKNGKMFAGSRKLWKRKGNSIWRQALKNNSDIELFCTGFPGYTLYGEVVPAQTGFDYGIGPNSTEVFFFDIRTPDGEWMPYLEARRLTETFDLLKWAPCLYQGRPQNEQDILKLVDGQTMTAGKHIREGIVIKVQPEKQVRGLGRAQVKIISNDYYDKTKE